MTAAMRVVPADPADPASAARWDSLTGPDDFYLSAAWARAVESMRPQRALHLAAVDDDGKPAGILPAYVIDENATSPFIRPDLVLSRLAAERPEAVGGIPDRELLPALGCGSRQVGQSRPLLGDGPPSSMAATTLIHASLDLASAEGARCVQFLYVDEHRHLLRRALRAAGFAEFFSGWHCVLDVPWHDFGGYLGSRSAGRRKQVVRERRELADAAISFSVTGLDMRDADRLAILEAAVHARHGNAIDVGVAASRLRGLAEAIPDAVLIQARRDGQRLGFLVLLPWHDRLCLANVGLDRRAAGRLPVYFGLMFYEPISLAVATGAVRLDYGLGSTEAKTSRGCRPVAQYGYLHCFDPDVAARVRRLAASLARPPGPRPALVPAPAAVGGNDGPSP
jgi:uncharacterized protein